MVLIGQGYVFVALIGQGYVLVVLIGQGYVLVVLIGQGYEKKDSFSKEHFMMVKIH